MSGGWQISVGQLSELARPALYALSVLLSALVLADARRRLRPAPAAAWTLSALVLPHVAVPVYLAARLLSPRTRTDTPTKTDTPTQEVTTPHAPGETGPYADRRADASTDGRRSDEARADEVQTEEARTGGARADEGQAEVGGVRTDEAQADRARPERARADEDGGAESAAGSIADADATAGHEVSDAHEVSHPRPRVRAARLLAVPAAYAALMLAAGAVYFYLDYTSFEARLVHATDAALYGRHGRAVEELRAALALRDDAHTHKLLGFELYRERRWDEALGAFRAAEAGGEPDDALPFHVAATLERLGRTAEAAGEYERFLRGPACAQAPDDELCVLARTRTSAPAR